MLEFRKTQGCDRQGVYEKYDIYDVSQGNTYGIGSLVRGLVFENDKYHCYKPHELIEIAEFIKARLEDQRRASGSSEATG